MRKKKQPTLTYEERINSVWAHQSAALSVFNGVISDLELAARDARDVSTDITYEIDRLEEELERLEMLRTLTDENEESILQQADKVRTFIGA